MSYNDEKKYAINSNYSQTASKRGTGNLTNDVVTNINIDPNKYTNTSLFANTKDIRDLTKYNLMRGVPDFGSLVQFNPYETGYATLIVCGMPRFIETLAKVNNDYMVLATNWKHIIEYEFKSFDGLQDINADTITLGDDLNSINVINKVNMQSATEFTLTYDEKSGSPLTKFAKLYLTGIKDPRTQVKSYHGLIHSGILNPGFENEVFTFLYIVTDNTLREVEAAYLLIGCQLLSADTDMYNYTKGDIQKREVQVKFSGYPISSPIIDKYASKMMKFLISTEARARQIVINSNTYNYNGIEKIVNTYNSYGPLTKLDDIDTDKKVESSYQINKSTN